MNGPVEHVRRSRTPLVRVSPAPRPEHSHWRDGQLNRTKQYAVLFDSRTSAGDPVMALHGQYETEGEAVVEAMTICRLRGRVWIERWAGPANSPRSQVVRGWRWASGCAVIDEQAGPRPEQLR